MARMTVMIQLSEILRRLRRGEGSFDRRFKQIVDIPLLIVDDFGLMDLSAREQIDVYEIVCGRYARRSTVITSNRDVSEWFSLF